MKKEKEVSIVLNKREMYIYNLLVDNGGSMQEYEVYKDYPTKECRYLTRAIFTLINKDLISALEFGDCLLKINTTV